MSLTGVHNTLVFIRVERSRVDDVLSLISQKHHVLPQQITTLPFSDGDSNQVLFMFTVNRNIQADICKDLAESGVGEYGSGSDVSILPLAIAKDVRKKEELLEVEDASASMAQPQVAKAKSQMSVFQSTIKARIAVENMLELVHEGASFSFDFFMLVIVASMLALIGLITNSAVVIVSAMLVSPLMGPILGFTFGSVVRDWQLVRTSLFSECLGLAIALTVGYIGGLFAAPASLRQTPWPTFEMATRGDRSALYTGAAIAIPSGVGVALSIMGQNTNSLVGVAISASLLPPAVNCGLLWAQVTLQSYYYNMECLSNGNNVTTWNNCCVGINETPTPLCPSTTPFAAFCCSSSKYSDLSIGDMGGISFALTLVNIACIWVFGALTFMFKEVAPLPNKSELWTKLVPNARAFNQAVNRGEIDENVLQEELKKERAKLAGRKHLGGHKLERAPKIQRGALQTRQYGAAQGMVFPTHGDNRKRALNSDILRNLWALYDSEDQDRERHDDDVDV